MALTFRPELHPPLDVANRLESAELRTASSRPQNARRKNQRSRLTMQQKMIGRPGNGQKKRPNQNKSTVRPKPQTNAQGNQQLQDSTRWQRKMNARPRTGPSLFHFSLLRLLSDSLASTQVADLQLSYGRYIPTRHLLGRLRNLPRSPKSIAPLD